MNRAWKWAGRGLLALLGIVLLLNGLGLTVWVVARRDRIAEKIRATRPPEEPPAETPGAPDGAVIPGPVPDMQDSAVLPPQGLPPAPGPQPAAPATIPLAQ